MTALLERIHTMMSEDASDLDEIERTLTDGYAEALALEAEQLRIERRMATVAQHIDDGDATANAQELVSLARQLDGSRGSSTALRSVLADLRSHASVVRLTRSRTNA